MLKIYGEDFITTALEILDSGIEAPSVFALDLTREKLRMLRKFSSELHDWAIRMVYDR